jgi:integrating conjugative element membrane protein (TIGR03747 family)
MSEKQTPIKQKAPSTGIASNVLFFIFKVGLMAIAAWFVLSLWFFGEVLLKGLDLAHQHAQYLVSVNADYIANTHSIYTLTIAHWLLNTHQAFTVTLQQISYLNNSIISTVVSLLALITEIDLTRVCIFVLAIPLLALILLVFATDGLVWRDIRKFQGARESTLKFHRVKKTLTYAFYIPLAFYLCAPIAINPIIFILVQALLTGLVMKWMATYFKKYV